MTANAIAAAAPAASGTILNTEAGNVPANTASDALSGGVTGAVFLSGLFQVSGLSAPAATSTTPPTVSPSVQPPIQPTGPATQNIFSELKQLISEVGELLKTLLKQLLPASSTPAAGTTAAPAASASTPSAAPANGSAATDAAPAAAPLRFSEKMKLVLEPDADKRVSENELRRGVITYQLYQKSPKLADSFVERYDDLIGDDTAKDLAVEKSLIALVERGELSRTDANWVFSLSHRAAQLDGNTAEIGQGSSGKEGFDLQGAIRCAEATLAGIQGGSIRVESKTL